MYAETYMRQLNQGLITELPELLDEVLKIELKTLNMLGEINQLLTVLFDDLIINK